jgi:hypothetical protein
MHLVSPAHQAATRRREAKSAMDTASYLATAMPNISPGLKKAAGQQILSGFRHFLELSKAATFWEATARRG